MRLKNFVFLMVMGISCICEAQVKPGLVDAKLVRMVESQVLVGTSVLNNDGYFVWGGSVIEGEDGRFHMFYSRWPSGPEHAKFADGWLLDSEIAYAVSDFPDRDFKFVQVILQGRIHEGRPNAWDAQSVHNPHIKKFHGKYYLYHTGSRDPGEQPDKTPGASLNKRSRIQQNQKIGVVEFESIDDLLAGSFTRPDKPLLIPRTRVKKENVLNPSPAGVDPLPDNLIVVNPSVVYRPSDKKYLLYFKGNLYDPYWKGAHGVALSDAPDGPFVPLDKFIFDLKGADGKLASAEDPYVWYNDTEKKFYAVFKDFTGKITGSVPGLAIMYSDDGEDWLTMENPMFMPLQLALKDGMHLNVDRLERPQLLISAHGIPMVLYAACSIAPVNQKKDGSSFNVQIPLISFTHE